MTALVALQLAGDPAVACFVDGDLRCAVRDSVLTRQPPADGFPSAALDAALAVSGVALRDVRVVVATGLAPPSAGGRVRALLGALGGAGGRFAGAGGRFGGDGVRVRSRQAARGPVARAGLTAALSDARLGHAAVEIVEPAWAMSHLRGREAWALPLGLPESNPAVLAIGAALSVDRSLRLPADPRWGPGFAEQEAYRALSNARLPRDKVDDPAGWARDRLAAGEAVVWAVGRASFLDVPLGPRVRLVSGPTSITADPRWVGPDLGGATATALVAPDGLPALSPLDVVSAWRALGGRLVLGPFVV